MRLRSEEYKKRQSQQQLDRRRKNPDKYREIGRKSEHNRRMRRYGVNAEWYAQQLSIQHNLCDICKDPLVPGRSTHIDHNHSTGLVRGLLCHHCNILIGNAKEDINRLMQAITYLERHTYASPSNS